MARRKSAPEAARIKKRTLVEKIHLLKIYDIPLIPKLQFLGLVRKMWQQPYRVTSAALVALQEASVMYLTYLFEDANLLVYHTRREVLDPADIRMVLYIREATATSK